MAPRRAWRAVARASGPGRIFRLGIWPRLGIDEMVEAIRILGGRRSRQHWDSAGRRRQRIGHCSTRQVFEAATGRAAQRAFGRRPVTASPTGTPRPMAGGGSTGSVGARRAWWRMLVNPGTCAPGRILSSTLAPRSTAAISPRRPGRRLRSSRGRGSSRRCGELGGTDSRRASADDGERHRAGDDAGHGRRADPRGHRARPGRLADVAASEPWPVLLVSHGGTLPLRAVLLTSAWSGAEAVTTPQCVGFSLRRSGTGGADRGRRALQLMSQAPVGRANLRRRGRGSAPWHSDR